MGIAINFDTLKISKELEKVGFSPQQAENYHQTRHRKIRTFAGIAQIYGRREYRHFDCFDYEIYF